MKILIKNAILLDMVTNVPNLRTNDILIENSIITKIDESILASVDKTIDASNMLVMPGLVNTHTHVGMSIFRSYNDEKKLMDWLNNSIFPIEDKLTDDDIYWNSCLSCIEMIKTGTTTFNDMYFKMENVIKAIEETGLRAKISWSVTDNSIRDKEEKTIEYSEKYNKENSRINVDVSIHAGYTCNPETIKRFVLLAKKLNIGIHTHLAETIDEDKIIKERYNKTPTEYYRDLEILDLPVILAHGVHLSDNDIEILKSIKGGISHNPISNCKLSSGICDVVKLRNAGISVGIGTDGQGSTTTLDMFEEMKVAAYLQKVTKGDPTCIKAYDILKMATIEGAKVLGLDKQIGTIEVGKKADIIIIDINKPHLFPNNDICNNIVYSANGADVNTVIVDGKVLMENRILQGIDEKNVMKNIDIIVNRLM